MADTKSQFKSLIADAVNEIIKEKNLDKEIFSFKDDVMTSDCLSAERMADGRIDVYIPNNGSYEYSGDCSSVSIGQIDPLLGEALTSTELALSGEF